ncbi:MAG: CrcB family protein [Dehalococcoidia bacterium]|nr:MAG: CrcB family protein [Dehalococcoidia bacterium]
MPVPVAIAIGGAAGSLARYWIATGLTSRAGFGGAGTFAVNLVGALAIGLVLGIVEGRADPPPRWLTLGLTTGILGGFTTFSAFAYDTVSHIEAGDAPLALAYVLGTVVLGIVAAAGGLALGRSL